MSLRTAYSAFIYCPLSIWCHFCGISIKGPLGSYLCTSGDELAIPTGGLFQLWLVLTVRTVLVFWTWARVPLPFTSKPSFTGWGDFKPVFFLQGGEILLTSYPVRILVPSPGLPLHYVHYSLEPTSHYTGIARLALWSRDMDSSQSFWNLAWYLMAIIYRINAWVTPQMSLELTIPKTL